MDDPSLQKFEQYYRDLSDERVEAELERWWSGSRQHKILVGILTGRRPTAQRAERAETVNDEFALAWEDLRERRLLYWVSLIAIIPVSAVCAFLLEYWHLGSSLLLLFLVPALGSVWFKLSSAFP